MNTGRVAEFEIATNPYDYKGATRAELGIGPEVTTSAFYNYESPAGQHVGVYGVQPIHYGEITSPNSAKPATHFIVPASHEYRFEDENLALQLQQMAATFNARVIFVDTPGTTGLYDANEHQKPVVYKYESKIKGLPGTMQTPRQVGGALKGDFRRHAAVQLDAIEHTFGLPDDAHYTIRGESMGAAVATDMLSLMYERGLNVDEVQMHEMVNAFSGRRLALPLSLAGKLSGVENDRRNLYIAENSDIVGIPSTAFELSGATDEERAYRKSLDDKRKTLGQQGIAGLVNGVGMATGRLESVQRVLRTLPSRELPLFTLARGRESTVTNADDYTQFADDLRKGHAAVRVATITDRSSDKVPMGHSHTFSLGRGADIYKALDKRH